MRLTSSGRRARPPAAIHLFPARHDWLVQTGDVLGAYHVAGAGVSADAQASWGAAAGSATARTG